MTEQPSIVCGGCGDEQTGPDRAPLCPDCSAALHGQLRAVRTYLGLLRDNAAGLSSVERPARGDDDVRRTLDGRYPLSTAVTRTPVDFGAVDAAEHLRGVVRAWALRLLDEQVAELMPPCPHRSCAGVLWAAEFSGPICPDAEQRRRRYAAVHDGLEDAAAWLADRWKLLRRRPWAGAAALQIGAAVRRAESHVDQPPPEHYAGHCDVPLEDPSRPGETFACGWELYARLGADVVRCRGCGTTHDVAKRRAQLLASAGDVLLTATQAARALSEPDHEVTAAMVRGWKHRGGLQQATDPDTGRPVFDDRGAPQYRLRDVQTAHNRIRYGTVPTTPREAS